MVLQCVHQSGCPAPHIGENCLLHFHADGIQWSDVVTKQWSVTQQVNYIVQTRALSVILVANGGDGASTVAVAGKTPTGVGSSKAVEAILCSRQESEEK